MERLGRVQYLPTPKETAVMEVAMARPVATKVDHSRAFLKAAIRSGEAEVVHNGEAEAAQVGRLVQTDQTGLQDRQAWLWGREWTPPVVDLT